uniref:isoamyl acetate-hydrolyzing esterase 1 homolog n=1 Tax=Myxine glutinosa TaxID=7769 RepID=UPI00358EF4A1
MWRNTDRNIKSAVPIVWPRLVLFGDSLSQHALEEGGWGSRLAEKLVRRCDVVCRGLSGYNSRFARLVLPRILPYTNKKEENENTTVTVLLGSNDSVSPVSPQQHVPLAEFEENLQGIVSYLASLGIQKKNIVVISPPPLCEPKWVVECKKCGYNVDRQNAFTGKYAAACMRVAAQAQTSSLDLWTLMQHELHNWQDYLSDGLHLSPAGQRFLAEALWTLLEPLLADLPSILPRWDAVNHERPEDSLLTWPQSD